MVRLPGEPRSAPPVPPSRPGRLHGIGIAGMALSAVVGFFALFAFVTVGWPGRTGRYVIMIVVFSGVVFMASAATAVLAAARDTYARNESRKEE